MVKRWNNSLRFVAQMDWDGFACLRLASLFFRSGAARRWSFFPSRYILFIPVPLFSHPFPSFSHPFPSFSILVHPCPILSPSYPFLSHPQYSVGLQDLPPERLQDRLENDGSQADLCWFAGFFKDTGWTLCHANPYEWIQVGCGTLVLFWNGPHASPCRFIL